MSTSMFPGKVDVAHAHAYLQGRKLRRGARVHVDEQEEYEAKRPQQPENAKGDTSEDERGGVTQGSEGWGDPWGRDAKGDASEDEMHRVHESMQSIP